jgi:hypothetical protein
MFRFTFESHFDTVPELRKEIENLLWQMDHTWPLSITPNQIDWAKEKIDTSQIKLNKGALRQSLDMVKNNHDHKIGCKFCPKSTT